jgi:hypothetical protein
MSGLAVWWSGDSVVWRFGGVVFWWQRAIAHEFTAADPHPRSAAKPDVPPVRKSPDARSLMPPGVNSPRLSAFNSQRFSFVRRHGRNTRHSPSAVLTLIAPAPFSSASIEQAGWPLRSNSRSVGPPGLEAMAISGVPSAVKV